MPPLWGDFKRRAEPPTSAARVPDWLPLRRPSGRFRASGAARVGRFRPARIRRETSASVIAASTRTHPPQRGQHRASISETRWRRSAHRVRRPDAHQVDGAKRALGHADGGGSPLARPSGSRT